MSVREPTFSTGIDDAPAWARRGITRFAELQSGEPMGTGASPSAYLVDGATRYYPNVGQPLSRGVIGALFGGAALVAFVIVAVVQLATTEVVSDWAYASIAASGGFIALSFAWVVAGTRPEAQRADGLYLLAEGLVFVREGRCACHAREGITEFRSLGTHEGVALTSGEVMPLLAGEHVGLRGEWESWRTAES